jgi:hypothetical protein
MVEERVRAGNLFFGAEQVVAEGGSLCQSSQLDFGAITGINDATLSE